MENPEIFVFLLIGVALGGVIGWLVGSRKGARAQAESRAAEQRLEEQREQSAEQLAALRESFKALSADALKEAQPELVRLAGETLSRLHESAKGELNTSKEAVAKLVAPLKQHLDTYQQRLSESEKNRNTQLGALREQLDALSENSRSLSSETEQLRMILNSSQARGRWGEETLRRVVEAAGLSSHCDFSEQTGSSEGRPDMIVHLPGGRHIVVDAKAPELSFLDELESGDAAQRRTAIEQHGKKMRETIKALADRNYPHHIDGALDCVVMFVPAESLFSAALEGDPDLIVWAAERRITLATPTSLIALLSSVRVSWQYHSQSENARAIAEAAQQLYKRLGTFLGHFDRIRTGLERANKAYNDAVGSYERSIKPSGERVNKLQVGETEGKELPAVEPVAEVLRTLPVPAEDETDQAESG
ncbi:MAG: DNA recombination protein RmuC [Verrucomicrobiota bacterium]|nr:DNA recombination protein RmuC [Verrucomicrobiota bacterium]MDP7440789.1 DNA recombination protein RmuC [Verrucomicrobiota bacterium]